MIAVLWIDYRIQLKNTRSDASEAALERAYLANFGEISALSK